MDELDGKGIAVKNLGPGIDRASGIKMVLCLDDEGNERAPGGDADCRGLRLACTTS